MDGGDHEVVGPTVGGSHADGDRPARAGSGHDVQPVAHKDNRLWVSTGSNVYQLDVRTGARERRGSGTPAGSLHCTAVDDLSLPILS